MHDAVYEQFSQRFAERVRELKVGHGNQEGTQIGPLISEKAVGKVRSLIDDAVAKGADLVLGGDSHQLGGNFFAPTILGGIRPGMELLQEEIFGPVAALVRFSSDDEVVRLANDTLYGLAAYFYSRDIGRVFKVAEKLEYGMVGVNTGLISNEVAPFGGVKQSGLGREGSKYGIEDYLEMKYLCLAV
ncbi:3-sulfolactaldehyde dehydrogenase [compost metagenome]